MQAVFDSSCLTGDLEQVAHIVEQLGFDPNHTEVWADQRAVSRQLQRKRGWFRERSVYDFSYKTGTHVTGTKRDIPRDVALEKQHLYCTSGLHKSGLHVASEQGHAEIVRFLLQHGANSALRDAAGKVALHYCAERGHVLTAKQLMEFGSEMQFSSPDLCQRTPVHCALYAMLRVKTDSIAASLAHNLDKIVDLLLPCTDLTIVDSYSHTALQLERQAKGDMFHACQRGDLYRVKRLALDFKEDTDARMSELGFTALHFACMNERVQVVECLCAQSADLLVQDAGGQTALHFCARNGNIDCARCLLQQSGEDAGPSAEHAANGCLTRDCNGRTPLLIALAHQQLEVALLLLRHCPIVVHFCDNNGVAPLHIAAALGFTGIAATIIRACEQSAVHGMLDCGISVEISSSNTAKAEENALASVRIHQVPWLHQYIRQFKKKGYPLPSPQDYQQHMKATMFKHNRRSTYTTPPLHVAIRAGHFQIVQLLLEEGADPSIIDTDVPAAIPIVDPRSVIGINAGGAAATSNAGRSAFDVAAALGQVLTMCTLLDYGAVLQHEQAQWGGHIMLLRSCHDLQNEVSEVLLDQKVDPNQASKISWTPLGDGAYSIWTPLSATFAFNRKPALCKRDQTRQLALAGLLVQHGADVNWRDAKGWTYLHHAAQEADQAAVRFLLDSSAFVPPWVVAEKGPVLNEKGPALNAVLSPLLLLLGRAGADLAHHNRERNGHSWHSPLLTAPSKGSREEHQELDAITVSLVRAGDAWYQVHTSVGMNCLQLAALLGLWSSVREMLNCLSTELDKESDLQIASILSRVLSFAIRARKPQMMERVAALLSRIESKLSPSNDPAEWHKALCVAARLDNVRALQTILNHTTRAQQESTESDTPCDIAVRSYDINTMLEKPLDYAVSCGNHRSAELLLSAGAIVTADAFKKALNQAMKCGAIEMTNVILQAARERGMDESEHQTMMMYDDVEESLLSRAVNFGHDDLSCFLLTHALEKNVPSTVLAMPCNRHILHRAARAGCIGLLRSLQKIDGVDLREATSDEHGITALQYARYFGQVEVAALLSECDSSEGHAPDGESNEPLICGAFSELMRSNEMQQQESSRPIPAKRGTISLLRNIVDAEEGALQYSLLQQATKAPRDIPMPSMASRELVCAGLQHVGAAARMGLVSNLRALAAAGANVNATWKGGSGLHWASRQGYMHVVKLLVDLGADLDGRAETSTGAPNNFATTAMLEAAKQGHGGVVLYLLAKGASPGALNSKPTNTSSTDCSILHLATQLHSESDARAVLALLLKVEEADLNVQDQGGLTPLAWACGSGRISLVLWMILNGARVEVDFGGRTHSSALQLLCSERQRHIVQASLQRLKLCILQCTACSCKGCSITDFNGRCTACGHSWAQHTHMPTAGVD
jgi:ankyrin repeat protein